MEGRTTGTALRYLLLVLVAGCWGEVTVRSSLYDDVRLPCWFPFIQGGKNLAIVWAKEEKDGKYLQVFRFWKGQNDFSNQNSQFRGRANLSGDISQGKLDMTLTGVTMEDQGVYYCRAANHRNHGDKRVELSVSEHADKPSRYHGNKEDNVDLVPPTSKNCPRGSGSNDISVIFAIFAVLLHHCFFLLPGKGFQKNKIRIK